MTIYTTIRDALAGLALMTAVAATGCATTGNHSPKLHVTPAYVTPTQTDTLAERVEEEPRPALDCSNGAFSKLESKLTAEGDSSAEKLISLSKKSGYRLEGDYIGKSRNKSGKFKVRYSNSWDTSLTIEVSDIDDKVKSVAIKYSVDDYSQRTSKIRKLKSLTFKDKEGKELFSHDGIDVNPVAESYASPIADLVWNSAITPINDDHKKCVAQRENNRKDIEKSLGIRPVIKAPTPKTQTQLPESKPEHKAGPTAPAHKLPFNARPLSGRGKKIEI